MQAISPNLTGHGGRIDEAQRLYPDAPRPWLDLSTGINPRPWQPPATLTVDPHPLPSKSDLRALETAAARHFEVDPDRVAAVPGSEIALRLLSSLGLPPIVSTTPAYATHTVIADHTNDTLIAAPNATLLFANPNNPEGTLIAPDNLLHLAHRQTASDGWLVVDEAFADAVPGSSLLPHLATDDPVIVLRSFGKYFGLAGLRLGFVIAPDTIIARVRHLLGDWPVSAHAIAYGRAAYEDRAWIASTTASLSQRAAALDVLLARHGLTAQGACPLYRLVETPDAAGIFDRLACVGILVRPFADRQTWLRFGLPADDAAAARLNSALTRG